MTTPLDELAEHTLGCAYCNMPADGPMLVMGKLMAHVHCTIRTLNELLDPDWEPGREPLASVGFAPGMGKERPSPLDTLAEYVGPPGPTSKRLPLSEALWARCRHPNAVGMDWSSKGSLVFCPDCKIKWNPMRDEIGGPTGYVRRSRAEATVQLLAATHREIGFDFSARGVACRLCDDVYGWRPWTNRQPTHGDALAAALLADLKATEAKP